MNSPDLSDYIMNGMLSIPHEDWVELNSQFPNDIINNALCDIILDGNVVLPMREHTYKDAEDSFKALCDYPCNPYQSDPLGVFTRYDYKYPLSGRIISESTIGNIASDYFQQYNRFCCDSINSPSPVRTWTNRQFLFNMLKGLWSMKYANVDMRVLRTLLALRKYTASQFKPTIAKSIYTKFQSRRVLDFSAGWGDRLCGFYSCPETECYIGCDPNKAVFDKYSDQCAMYSSLAEPKQVSLYNCPAEELDIGARSVDTVFTSPPYFNIEKYSKDSTQSSVRYRTLDKWLNGFLYPSLDMAWNALNHGGILAINISDVYSNHTVNNICDPMNDYLSSLGGVFVEGLGMKMSKRPNSGALKGKTGTFVEPIWVWKKE